jgi:carboxypeptidase D
LIGQIHGDETPGYYASHHFLETTDSTWANDYSLYVIPTLVPDALHWSRNTRNGVDLNRSFTTSRATEKTPRETRLFMNFLEHHPDIVLGITLHSGATVVCYPYDEPTPGSGSCRSRRRVLASTGSRSQSRGLHGVNAPSPDDVLYRRISQAYAAAHPTMARSRTFDNGIVNGSHWYAVHGSLGDYCYRHHGVLSLTVELTDRKDPADAVERGAEHVVCIRRAVDETFRHTIRGQVVDGATGQPAVGSTVHIVGHADSIPIRTHPKTAVFHRPCDQDATWQLHATRRTQVSATVEAHAASHQASHQASSVTLRLGT